MRQNFSSKFAVHFLMKFSSNFDVLMELNFAFVMPSKHISSKQSIFKSFIHWRTNKMAELASLLLLNELLDSDDKSKLVDQLEIGWSEGVQKVQ